MQQDSPPPKAPPPSPEETVRLLQRIHEGDTEAVNELIARIEPRLRRWAHGQLPRAARGMLETNDIVQVVASNAARQLARLEFYQSVQFAWYLRAAIKNAIGAEWRRADRTPIKTSLKPSLPADMTSQLERLLGAERMRRYEAALDRLDPTDREVIHYRIELAYDYKDLARLLGKPSEVAARVAVHRAIKRLTEEARHV